MDWRGIGKVLLAAAIFFVIGALAIKLKAARITINNLHAAYPCKESVARTTSTNADNFGVLFDCLDDRQVPQYSCGDGKCIYGCSCSDWNYEHKEKAK